MSLGELVLTASHEVVRRCSGGRVAAASARGQVAGHACGFGGRSFTNSNPNRPLMQRWPSVTDESSGEVTFTIVLSWTCRSSVQPTPQ